MRSIEAYAFATVAFMAAATALAAPPAIVTDGRGAAMACAGCHGIDGAGSAGSGTPVLAQLPKRYFIKQIADFKSGARSHVVMTAIAKALSAEEIESAARYYESLPRPASQPAAVDAAVIARGEELAINGDWDRQIPPCFKCHADNGLGVSAAFPPIAGQHATYTVRQLQDWRGGDRTNDPQQLMKAVAEHLTDDDVQAVAAYLATLGPEGRIQSSEVRAAVPIKRADEANRVTPAGFVPPPESAIPKNDFGEMVLLGRNIFVNTQQYASGFVGNGLNCGNCHLNKGRKADSAPLWAAYVLYPAYRKKTRQVDTIQSRIQGCFRFSMDGTPPPADSNEMTALVTYHYWLASGAPTGVRLPGQGFTKVPKPPRTPDVARGADVYKKNCAVCHGADGEGTKAQGAYAFPPLWGRESFNWGAGMHRIDTAAGFIQANMPYGRGGTLSDQEAWDVALFMNSHERPGDPRFEGSIERTRDKEHDENCLYGRTPAELAALLERQAKAEAEQAKGKAAIGKSQAAPQQSDGMSPATAH